MKIKFLRGGQTTRTQESRCPECNAVITAATSLRDIPDGANRHQPKPGDFSVCVKCGEILTFREDMTTERATHSSLEELRRVQPDTYDYVTSLSRELREAVAAAFLGIHRPS